jgi:hypothetical protein
MTINAPSALPVKENMGYQVYFDSESQHVIIKFDNKFPNTEAIFSIYDPQGRLILKHEIRLKETTSINLQSFEAGAYFWKLIQNKTGYSGKILVTE